MLNDVEELKRFAGVHARAQRIPYPQYEAVLGRITHDREGTGSWAGEWSRVAQERERQDDLLGASRLYTMARFPYVDGDARRDAGARAIAAFDRWRIREAPHLQPLDVEADSGRIRCLTVGTRRRTAPFVIMMGGIVSTKEQWAPILLRLPRFGAAGLVAEMPGVGANTLPYDRNSWRMFSAILDAVGSHVDTTQTYAMAMSFSGHLALRCALEDSRIRGVLTVGAPIRGVFADASWQRNLPRVTIHTLAHLTGTKPTDLGDHLRDWALTAGQLKALEIPVSYVASKRDEIIPASDISLLKSHVRRLRLLENDDVHGSPRYLGVTGPWLMRELLRAHGSRAAQRATLGALIPLLRARHRLHRTR